MAKFNHAAKWDRREQSRKAREAANSIRMDHFDLGGMRPIIVCKSDAREMDNPFGLVTVEMVQSFGKFINKSSAGRGDTSETAEEREARQARLQAHIDKSRLENIKRLAFDKVSKGEFDEEFLVNLFEPEQVERLRIQAGQIMTIRDQITSKFLETGLPEVVTTIGVYPNGPSATNGVLLEDLPHHIWYNESWRPGRGLIVNGEIWFAGGVEAEKLEAERLKYADLTHERSTAPYH